MLYFSGHGITDDLNHLYLANCQTSKENFRARAVPARFIQQESMNCYTRRQVIILDCCYSGAFKDGWQAKTAGLDLKQELGAEGRVVLTSSTATQTSFQQQESDLSLYIQYLVEGIETGAADTDRDGKIFVHELHDYAKVKVREARPAMKPDILLDREGFNILFSKAPIGDRTLEFRRLVEKAARQGEISSYRRDVLRLKQREWGLSEEAAERIINSVLEPYRRRLANIERFRTALQEEVDKQFPIDPHLEADLRDWQQQVLGLADEDVVEIWQQVTSEKAGDYAARLQRYKQALTSAVQSGYPLSASARQELSRLQETLRLRDEDLTQIEAPTLELAEAQYQTYLQRQEAKKLKQQRKAENLRQEGTENLYWQEFKRLQQQAVKKLQQQELDRLQHHQTQSQTSQSNSQTAPSSRSGISRQQFLKWAGLGGSGFIASIVISQLIQNQPQSTKDQSQTITVAEPKYTTRGSDTPIIAGLPRWRVDFETLKVDGEGNVAERIAQQAFFVKEELDANMVLEMVEIPGVSFQMGSPESEEERYSNEGPQHTVTVESFLMGKYPITQTQWRAIATLPKVNRDLDPNPSRFEGSQRPVEQISWYEAVEFCDRLSQKTGRIYRLPSEAEWEYACRAGTTTPFHFGETITTDLANYNGNGTYGSAPKGTFRGETTDVGSFPPNAFGLFDMHGNVWEWCLDHYHDNYTDAPTDGSAWLTDNQEAARLLRGGSWAGLPAYCRSAHRLRYDPGYRFINVGFRVVLRPASSR